MKHLCFVLWLSGSLLLGAFPRGALPAYGKDASAPTKIDILLSTRGNDIAFDQTAIQVPLGQKVQLKFINQAAKNSEILHNVAILKPGTMDAFIKDLQAAIYDLDKIKSHKALISVTKTLEPGAEGTLEFTPTEPGLYPYICLMPGHGDMLGMKGMINITNKQ